MKEKQKFKTDGFTLIELMITIAVLAILAGVAVPGFQTLIRDNRMTAQVNDMITALHLARTEAIKRRTNVSLCESDDGADCGGGWGNGWIVFVDPDGNGTLDTADPDEELLQVHGPLTGGNTLSGNFGLGATTVTYKSIGLLDNAGNQGNFSFCDARGSDHAKTIIIGSTGRPYVSDKASDGTTSISCPT